MPKIVIDRAGRVVQLDNQVIALTRTEFDLLSLLMASNGSVLSTRHLYEQVWGPWFGSDHVVEVHVSRLRRKLGETALGASFIQTVRGIGYRFQDIANPIFRTGVGAVTVTNTTQRVMWANDLIELVLGRPRQQVVGDYLMTFIAPGDAERWTQHWNAALRGDTIEISVRAVNRERGTQQVGAEMTRLTHEDGQPCGVVTQWHQVDGYQ